MGPGGVVAWRSLLEVFALFVGHLKNRPSANPRRCGWHQLVPPASGNLSASGRTHRGLSDDEFCCESGGSPGCIASTQARQVRQQNVRSGGSIASRLLARMEVNSFFSELLPRLKSIELAGDPQFAATTFVHMSWA
jgi:hypothetical protein